MGYLSSCYLEAFPDSKYLKMQMLIVKFKSPFLNSS